MPSADIILHKFIKIFSFVSSQGKEAILWMLKKNRQNTHLLFGGLNADGGKVSTNTISTTERLFLIHYAKKKFAMATMTNI